ncbi:hypothetical protein VTL71DRAFT_1302 [Oculimacula yallundae]|uniref:Uncharacterized protein n=1 Tax=Oculimacula yallundae TaxID=86028 RepID=A0ABR4CCQ4_9HELO
MAAPRKGLVHQYFKRATAFEHTPNTPTSPAQNILLFIGGLSDGLLTVPYTTPLAASLPPTWTLAEVHLSSSYSGWGICDLSDDADEISKCVTYFRGIKTGKVVLMGHSTGCQDIMFYLTGTSHSTRAKIDGAIMQGVVSDRQALEKDLDPALYARSCAAAKAMIEAGDGDEILPPKTMNDFFEVPVSAKRWLSLASPDHDGDDDFFSSDLSDEQLAKTFGTLPKETIVCILHSGNDEFVDPKLDKDGIIRKWIGFIKKGGGSVDEVHSGVLEGATHNLKKASPEVLGGLLRRVLGFLDGLDGKQANL